MIVNQVVALNTTTYPLVCNPRDLLSYNTDGHYKSSCTSGCPLASSPSSSITFYLKCTFAVGQSCLGGTLVSYPSPPPSPPSPPPPSPPLVAYSPAGVAIYHGYLANCTVFFDVNGNMALDAGEPSTTTSNLGRFTFDQLVRGGGFSVATLGTCAHGQARLKCGHSFHESFTPPGGQCAAFDSRLFPAYGSFSRAPAWASDTHFLDEAASHPLSRTTPALRSLPPPLSQFLPPLDRSP